MYKKFTKDFLWTVMRISFVVLFILTTTSLVMLASPGSGQGLKDSYVEIHLGKVPLETALKELQSKTHIGFAYDPRLLDGFTIGPVYFPEKARADKVLQRLLENKPFSYREVNGIVVVSRKAKKLPKPGTVTGLIIDSESGEALTGATVAVKGNSVYGVADIDGRYSLRLEPGSYDLEFRFLGYQVKVVQGVVVKDNELTALNVAMQSDMEQLGEVVITAEYDKASVEGLLVKQKHNVSMTDGMSAEQIRLTPDNNTAQVLKRVSGVTVQNDRFVTIRGLSDRYNNVLINGASAPSTEPNRRNFGFDIVPSALVDNVLVNKTASPDLPGEFTGGIVMINTRDIPDRNFVSLTVGRGVNSGATGRSMLSTQRDKHAIWGGIDEEKKWFGDGRLFDQPKYYSYIAANDQRRMDSIGSKIPNRWQLYRYLYTPMQNYQLSAGMVKDLKGAAAIGFTSAMTYRNEQLIESGKIGRMFNADSMFVSDRYKYNTSVGLLLNTAYKSARHQLAWKNLYNNRYSNQFDEQLGYDLGDSKWQRRLSDVTLGNRLIQSRVEGTHSFAGIKVEWHGDVTDLLREQPDGRFSLATHPGIGGDDPDEYIQYQFSDSFIKYGGLYAARLKETKKNAGIGITVPLQVLRGRQLIKAGYALSRRSNDYDGAFLRILGNPPGELSGFPYYQIATPELFASGVLRYRPSFVASQTTGDRYTGEQDLAAYYGMADLTLLKKVRFTGGVRYENNEMRVNTIFYSTSTGYGYDSVKNYIDRNWLPSLNITYSATKKFNVRASYSKTLARPDFVERSPYIYFDFAENLQVTGQRELDITRITNYDFRLEYYFTPGEIVSASVFYKDFLKPVERFFYVENGSNGVQYWNLHSASARGVELNFIKSLNFTGVNEHWLKNLYISGNVTLLEGEIFELVKTKSQAGEDSSYVSSFGRPVQGLSPYTLNGGLGYQSARWGINAVYNKFGKRIVNGGTQPHRVQYEVPRDVIDLQINWAMMKSKLMARINISDLLNQPFIIYANNIKDGDESNKDPEGDDYNPEYDYVTYNVKKGTGYSFSLTYTF